MNLPNMVYLVLSAGPFATLLAAAMLRIVAAAQPESAWSNSRRQAMVIASYLLLAISMAGMIFLLFAIGPIGMIGVIMSGLLAATLIESEIRIAGVRNRARQVEFLWVLAMAVKSHRPLPDEIESFAQGVGGARRRKLIELAERLRENPLTEIVVPRGLLPRSVLLTLHMGISSKSLEDVLQSSAARVTRQVTEDQSTPYPASVFIYPAAIVPVIFGIVGFLMYYIVPKLKKIFDDFGTELPRLTVLLIQTTDLLVHSWYLFALPMIYVPLFVFIYVLMAEYYGWQVMWQFTLGRWLVRCHAPDVLRSLSVAVTQRIPIDQALITMSRYAAPTKLRGRLTMAADEIQHGTMNWQALQKAGFIKFHETVLLETAQRSGNLGWAMETLASNLERRWSFRLDAALELVHPMLIVFISIGVGFVALAIFLPLVKLLNDLS